MSRDKQTEIANDLNMHCVSLSEQFCGEMSCNACISTWLYNAGYRKASDLAEEIFAEIEKVVGYALCVDLTDWSAYTELKKKYIGKDTNVLTKDTEGGE